MRNIDFRDPLSKGTIAFDRIAYLQEMIRTSDDDDITLRVYSTGRIGLTFVFLLGSLPLYAEKKGKTLRVRVNEKIYKLMAQINILEYYKQRRGETNGYQIEAGDLRAQPAFKVLTTGADVIPFVHDMQMEAPIQTTEENWEALTSRIGEIYLNALEHSGASVVLGGKYFKLRKYKYCFSCYDNGMGIPGNVNAFFKELGQSELADGDALQWAMQKGHTTKSTQEIPRGLGLDLLRSFAIASGGVIRICSGRSLYVLRGEGKESYCTLDHSFDGTLFEMDVFSNSVPVF